MSTREGLPGGQRGSGQLAKPQCQRFKTKPRDSMSSFLHEPSNFQSLGNMIKEAVLAASTGPCVPSSPVGARPMDSTDSMNSKSLFLGRAAHPGPQGVKHGNQPCSPLDRDVPKRHTQVTKPTKTNASPKVTSCCKATCLPFRDGLADDVPSSAPFLLSQQLPKGPVTVPITCWHEIQRRLPFFLVLLPPS